MKPAVKLPIRGRERIGGARLSKEKYPERMKNVESSFSIRMADVSDRPAMIRVVNAAFAVEQFLEGTRTDDERMAEMMQKGTFLVAGDAAGKIVASVYTEMRGDRAYFGMLAVDPARQGSGLGRQMIEASENFCRSQGAQYMDITVLSLRPELPPLYRSLGYAESGTEEFKPSRPLKAGVECHAIIMSKKL
jgi:ribosomal protein S18 acetylase RimI-like enzyme